MLREKNVYLHRPLVWTVKRETSPSPGLDTAGLGGNVNSSQTESEGSSSSAAENSVYLIEEGISERVVKVVVVGETNRNLQ